MSYPYMGVPQRLQRAFDKMLESRSHIELGKAYQDSASEIIRTKNSGAFDDAVMYEFFVVHNSIYEKMAKRFPCAPRTPNEFLVLSDVLYGPWVQWGKGWMEWRIAGRQPSSLSRQLTIREKAEIASILQRWIHCEFIKPDGRGGYTIGEEGRRLQSALMVGKKFSEWAAVDMI